MLRLASWVVVAVAGLLASSVCRAEDGELLPNGEGYTESSDGVRPIQGTPPGPGVPTIRVITTGELPPTPGSGSATSVSVFESRRMSSGRLLAERSAYGFDTDYPVEYGSSPLQNANAQRAALIQSLQALQDTYCRNAQLDEALAVRDMIRQLQAQAVAAGSLPEPVVTPPPGAVESPYAYDLRGQNGKTFYRRVTGSVDGYVWGGENHIYTDDSILATAAVHAGVLKAGETAMIRFTILAGKDSYVGSTRNGVTTRPYQSYGGSICIDGAGQELTTAYELRGQDKPPFVVYVVGRTDGSVYGTGSYTDDSDFATAAVHAGLVKVGEAGFVMVTLEGGKSAYEASTQNGVTTYTYGSWGGGYRLSAYGTPDDRK
jgi:LCCL domain